MIASIVKGRQEMIRKSVKKNLRDVPSGAFRRRKNVEFDEVTLDCSSRTSSECSTLIDFIIDEPEEPNVPRQEESDPPNVFLEEDNQAWNTRIPRIPSPSVSTLSYLLNTPRTTNWSDSRPPSLLDEEECTWVMPRASVRCPSKVWKRRTLFNKKSKALTSASAPCQSTDLLEPEERSWM